MPNAPNTNSTAIAAAQVMVKTRMSIWNVPVAYADAAYNIAWALLIIGAVLTLVGTLIVFWAGAVRDTQSAQQISRAQQIGAQAHEAAALANRDAAEANERTAQLQKDAAALRLELEQERQRHARRTLSAESAEILETNIKKYVSAITVVEDSDVETSRYSREIQKALNKGGVQIHLHKFIPGRLNPGLTIYVPGAPQDLKQITNDPVVVLFQRAGISTGWTTGTPSNIRPGLYAILIGPKPLPPDVKKTPSDGSKGKNLKGPG